MWHPVSNQSKAASVPLFLIPQHSALSPLPQSKAASSLFLSPSCLQSWVKNLCRTALKLGETVASRDRQYKEIERSCGAAEYQPVEFSLTNVLPVLPDAP
ncbi:hypothetical protein [Coleofasciculus sp. H7-2]|uniref:hypothetical protein n=1 Tax=Coleofasciculus sp. H7-2 TaxID=3351545 RepID=UPI003670F411